jgi:hypothetical protein
LKEGEMKCFNNKKRECMKKMKRRGPAWKANYKKECKKDRKKFTELYKRKKAHWVRKEGGC